MRARVQKRMRRARGISCACVFFCACVVHIFMKEHVDTMRFRKEEEGTSDKEKESKQNRGYTRTGKRGFKRIHSHYLHDMLNSNQSSHPLGEMTSEQVQARPNEQASGKENRERDTTAPAPAVIAAAATTTTATTATIIAATTCNTTAHF